MKRAAVVVMIGLGFGCKRHSPEPTPPPPPSPIASAAPAPTESAPSPAPESSDRDAGPKSKAPFRGVTRVDDTHYVVDRGFVADTLDREDTVFRSLRLVPDDHDPPDGVRVFGVFPASTAGKLGIQNGDTLIAVNGYPLTKPEKAQEIYASLRHASEVTLDIRRRGAPLTLQYRITE